MNSNTSATTEQLVRTLNKKWMLAYTTRDYAFLEAHMSDDYVGTFPDGSVHGKKSEIAAVKSGAVAITEMEPLEMHVQVFHNHTALLTGRSRIRAVVNGKAVTDDFRFTDVWVKNGEQWQAVASQVTRIAGADAAPGEAV